jgi:probable rRNA maturation factor
MVEIYFEDTENLDLSPDFFVEWFKDVAQREGKELGDITLVFCSDDYLLEINQQHLSHDYYTDIITFDYCFEDVVSGDLFISVDRVKENAKEFNYSFEHELHRVSIHGVLHLCGYKDKGEADEKLMREKEDASLALISFT